MSRNLDDALRTIDEVLSVGKQDTFEGAEAFDPTMCVLCQEPAAEDSSWCERCSPDNVDLDPDTVAVDADDGGPVAALLFSALADSAEVVQMGLAELAEIVFPGLAELFQLASGPFVNRAGEPISRDEWTELAEQHDGPPVIVEHLHGDIHLTTHWLGFSRATNYRTTIHEHRADAREGLVRYTDTEEEAIAKHLRALGILRVREPLPALPRGGPS